MWIAYRIGIALVALAGLLALFICQYRLSSRLSNHLSRREAAHSVPHGEPPQVRGTGPRAVQSSDVANWN